jgi:hypothetical protein
MHCYLIGRNIKESYKEHIESIIIKKNQFRLKSDFRGQKFNSYMHEFNTISNFIIDGIFIFFKYLSFAIIWPFYYCALICRFIIFLFVFIRNRNIKKNIIIESIFNADGFIE